MQVSEVHDHVNHAIIGGSAPIEMGISTSPEFFDILSNALYTDQKLATVRETLCNAWDAHIEANIRETPVEVTVTAEHLIIKDFGKGIHKDDMGPIYGIYGNSTKKHDGNQTGGFGLGCKAPFSYQDHFEVISCHEGVRTVYRMSKSSVVNNGRPAIVPIVSAPTEETGLTVKIDLKCGDQYTIHGLVGQIAFNGEMLVKLNGTLCNRLGFDHAVHPYFLYRGFNLLSNDPTITIRYGNVVYPLPESSELRSWVSEIKQFLELISAKHAYGADRYRILFQAPAHGLSVTPSREAISMQEHTINTLKTLFTSFLIEKKDNFDEECNNVAAEAIETAVKKKAYSVLLRQRMRLPFLEKKEGSASKLTNFKEIAEQYLSQRYPSDKSFCIADWKCRVMVMSQAGLIDRGMASTWLREVDSIKRVPEEYYVQREDNSWLQHRVLRPLLGKLTMDPNMDPERLFVVDPQAAYAGRSNRDPEIVQAKHMVPKHHLFTAPYLRNIVVLVRRRQDIHNRVTPHPDFEKFGKSMGYLVYHVGLKKIEADQAREFFSKTKYTVIDMIERQDWEPEPETRTPLKQVIADYVPRPRGLVTINALRENPTSHYIDVSNHNRDGNARLVNPEFVVRINLGGRNSRPDNTLGWLNWDASQALARLYGDRGGVCPTDAQYTNYVTNKGALSLQDFLLREFVPVLQQNLPALKEWWSFQPERIIQSYEWGLQIGRKSLLETIMKIPELAQQFKIVPPKDKIKPEIIYLYDALAKLSGIDDPAFLAIKVEINAVALNPDFALLMKKVADSISFNMLDVHDIYRTYNQLKDTKNPKPRIDKFVEIFVSILEN